MASSRLRLTILLHLTLRAGEQKRSVARQESSPLELNSDDCT